MLDKIAVQFSRFLSRILLKYDAKIQIITADQDEEAVRIFVLKIHGFGKKPELIY